MGICQVADSDVHLDPVFVAEDGIYTVCCVLGNVEIGYARCAKQDRDEGRKMHGDVLKEDEIVLRCWSCAKGWYL